MAFRKCMVCAGTGYLWRTPPLIEEGGLQSSNPSKYPTSSPEVQGGGLEVKCWRCLGAKQVPDERQDIGESL